MKCYYEKSKLAELFDIMLYQPRTPSHIHRQAGYLQFPHTEQDIRLYIVVFYFDGQREKGWGKASSSDTITQSFLRDGADGNQGPLQPETDFFMFCLTSPCAS